MKQCLCVPLHAMSLWMRVVIGKEKNWSIGVLQWCECVRSHYSITPLLHYSITPLLHYSIACPQGTANNFWRICSSGYWGTKTSDIDHLCVIGKWGTRSE